VNDNVKLIDLMNASVYYLRQRGYRFAFARFLSVCQQESSKSCQRILMNFLEWWASWPATTDKLFSNRVIN